MDGQNGAECGQDLINTGEVMGRSEGGMKQGITEGKGSTLAQDQGFFSGKS